MAGGVAVEIPVELDGERVDKALAIMIQVSRARARALIGQGVTVDGHPVRPSDRVSAGSIVVSPEPPSTIALEPEPVPFEVPYEDESLIVVDKPPGIVVHPGSGHRRGTLAAGLLHRYPELQGVGAPDRWGLVHRLDKDTSGVLLVGRTVESHEFLAAQLRERKIKRVYTTLCSGTFTAPTGTIDAPIGRDPARPTRRAVIRNGKPATTHYKVIQDFPDHDCTLLSVELGTGRTHQIRVHLAAIGHPVVGDRTYGTESRVSPPRVFLHSSRLELTHPVTRGRLTVEAALPSDLRSVLNALTGQSAE